MGMYTHMYISICTYIYEHFATDNSTKLKSPQT